MASLDVIALDPVTPQLRAPGVGDTYHFCRVVEFQDGTVTVPSITNVGDADTGIYWPADNAIAFTTAGVQRLSLGATTVFNEDGADVDFRVEGDTDANLLFVDASTDRIGVGTASPAFKLDVIGTGKVSALYLTDMTAGSGALYYSTGAENRLTLANYNVGGTIFFETNGGAYAGAIDASQNWGIGTTTPNVRLDVAGAMRLRGSTSGYVGLQAAAVAGTTTYTLPSADGSNGQVLTTNGTGTLSWTTNAGGDVTGPASASDNAIARFDGTTGKLIQNSAVFVDDDGDLGIGTSTPSEKLQIESGTPRIYINATTNSASAGMYFRVKDGSGNADNSGIFLEPTANIANRYINFSASNIGSDMAIRAGGNVGIGTTSPAAGLHVANGNVRLTNGSAFTTGNALIREINAAAGSSNQFVTSSIGFRTDAFVDSGIITFSTASSASSPTERMRLDASGNLGLGTSSPGAKLDVVAVNFVGGPVIGARFNTSNARIGFNIANANGYPYIGYNTNNTSSSDTPTYDLSQAAAQLRMDNGQFRFNIAPSGTAGNAISFTQAMTLDASGNLGLGVTPSAGSVHFDVSNGGSFYGLGTGAQLAGNSAFSGGTWVYRGSGRAARIDINNGDSGGMSFNVASASGTAGNNITFTQAMTLDASGNLGVGTTSPAVPIDVTKTGFQIGSTNGYIVGSFRDGTPNKGIHLGYDSSSQTGIVVSASTSASSNLAFWTYDSSGSGWAERARITSGGDLLVGSTVRNFEGGIYLRRDSGVAAIDIFAASTSEAKIQFLNNSDNSAIGNGDGGQLRFYAGGRTNERVRITGTGAFLVRTTAGPTTAWNSNSIANINGGLQLTHPAGTGRWRQLSWSGDGGDGNLYFPGGTSLATVANVAWLDVTGVWVNASDARQKTNIREIHHGLASVLQTQPRAYNRNDTEDNFVGFVAQELKQVIPEVVRGSDKTSYGVDYGSLVAVAFKAIQELKAELDAAKIKIAALEAK